MRNQLMIAFTICISIVLHRLPHLIQGWDRCAATTYLNR